MKTKKNLEYNFGLWEFLTRNNILHFITYSGVGEDEEVTYYIQTGNPNQLLVLRYKGSDEKNLGYKFSSMSYHFCSMELIQRSCIEDLLSGRKQFTSMYMYKGENAFDKGDIFPFKAHEIEYESEEGSEEQ